MACRLIRIFHIYLSLYTFPCQTTIVHKLMQWVEKKLKQADLVRVRNDSTNLAPTCTCSSQMWSSYLPSRAVWIYTHPSSHSRCSTTSHLVSPSDICHGKVGKWGFWGKWCLSRDWSQGNEVVRRVEQFVRHDSLFWQSFSAIMNSIRLIFMWKFEFLVPKN